jgi:hypothetical protein
MSLVKGAPPANTSPIATTGETIMNASISLASLLICQPPERRRAAFAARSAPAPAMNATEFLGGMHSPPAEQALAKSQLLALPDANTKLVCLEGELWLTRAGDSEDYILGPGRSFTVRRSDRAAVQALKASRVRLTPA